MAIALVSHVGKASTNTNDATTTAIDTTGASLLIAAISNLSGLSNVVTDSKGNTWTALTPQSAGSVRVLLFYATNVIVGTGHTFTVSTVSASYPSIAVAAFSGAHATSPFDLENGTTTSATTIQPGSITPTAANELVITAVGQYAADGGTVSIGSSYAISDQVPFGGGVNLGCALAYLVQTTAAATNPTWTLPASGTAVAVIAAFKEAAGGGGGPITLTGVAVNARAGETSRPGLPEEPRLYYDTTYVAPTGTVYTPADATAFQAALTACSLGADIQLTAGASYTGNFTLPAGKTGSGYITIRSSATLTTEGVRITTAQAAGFPKIVTNNVGAAIQAAAGAFYYRFINCEFTSGSSPVNGYLVGMGTGSETSEAACPHHIIIDRCYLHGHATNGGRRGVMFAGSYQAVIDSYLSDWKDTGGDTQAIACWTGGGPYKIVNNYLEASGENVMFGGSDTAISNLSPSDIEVRNNFFFKPLTWRIGDPSYLGVAWSVKNIFELKHAKRVIITGNRFENCWIHAQAGYCVLFTGRNQSTSNPWACVNDVTFTNNEIVNSSNGINLMGQDFESGTPSDISKRILISDNLMTGIGAYSGEGILFLVSVGYEDIKIDHNTSIHTGAIISVSVSPSPRFIFTNNITPHNLYGIYGDAYGVGQPAIDHYFPDSTITKNVMQGMSGYTYPAGNYFPTNTGDVGFENYPTDLRLDPTSPYHNAGTDGTDIGAILGPQAPAFKAAWAASSNQLIQ